MIEVRNLVKKYGDHLAVDHLSFQIEAGRIYGFLGPNGAGKSTTMNIMTGYLGATEGEVLIDGHDILKEPEEAKRHIGYLPEQPPLYMDMTVREYLEFAAELKGLKKKQRSGEIEEVEKMVRIKDVEHRLIKNLSKGYRQRVGLAQAVLGFPEIIILDEPSVGLDPKQIIEIRELIRKLAKNHTVILSSHILAEVREVCDYIMIISKGKLVASDTPENLERMLGQNNIVEIEARTTTAEVRRILKNVPGIERIETQAGVDGTARGMVREKKGEDIRESIFRSFASAGIPLMTLKVSGTTLEDVFMELTQRDTVPAAFSKDIGWKELIPQAEETEAVSGPGQETEVVSGPERETEAPETADAEEVGTAEADIKEMTAGKGEEQDAGNL